MVIKMENGVKVREITHAEKYPLDWEFSFFKSFREKTGRSMSGLEKCNCCEIPFAQDDPVFKIGYLKFDGVVCHRCVPYINSSDVYSFDVIGDTVEVRFLCEDPYKTIF